jgi:hypothetical protein
MESYTFLIDNFEPNDEIYLFGAVTGGAAARSLAALVGRCGILRRDKLTKLRDALQLAARKSAPEEEARRFRMAHAVPIDGRDDPDGAAAPAIAYLGLWESSLPMSALQAFLRLYGLAGPPRSLAENFTHVRALRHAIALDETFPILECASVLGSGAKNLKEEWFPGALYELIQQEAQGKPLGNSGAPMLWIFDGAEEAGLALDRLHPRYLEATQAKPEMPVRRSISFLGRSRVGPDSAAHVSDAVIRLQSRYPEYRPISLRRIAKDLEAISKAQSIDQ